MKFTRRFMAMWGSLLSAPFLFQAAAAQSTSCPCSFAASAPSFAGGVVDCRSEAFGHGWYFSPAPDDTGIRVIFTHPKNGNQDIWSFNAGSSCVVTHNKVGKNSFRAVKRDTQIVENLTSSQYNACLDELAQLASNVSDAAVRPLQDFGLDLLPLGPDGLLDLTRETDTPGEFELCPPGTGVGQNGCFAPTVALNSCDPANTLTNIGVEAINAGRAPAYDFPLPDYYRQ